MLMIFVKDLKVITIICKAKERRMSISEALTILIGYHKCFYQELQKNEGNLFNYDRFIYHNTIFSINKFAGYIFYPNVYTP